MTQQDYLDKKRAIQEQSNLDLRKLEREYALSNNPYKIGDIVTDHIGSMKITQINVSMYEHYPSCVYKGVELKKDGKPAKRQNHTTVWQCNIKNETNDKV